MSTLAELLALLETELKDTEHTKWSEDELTAHIRRALRAYNRVDPRRDVGVIPSVAGQREYDLAALGEVMEVYDVWYPWQEDDPAFPPERPRWSCPLDGVLRLEVECPPDGEGDDIRVFYTTPHHLEDLDGASETTLDAQAEQLIVLGASAYAVMQLAASSINLTTVSGWTPRQYADWASDRAKAFEVGLEQVRRRATTMQESRVAWGLADRRR